MGLDSVELVIEVEKQFGIQIENEVCEQIRTVDEFTQVIYDRVNLNPSEKCLTQVLFYKVRQVFISFGAEKRNIFPHSVIREFLNQENIAFQWKEFSLQLDLKLPDLVRLDINPELNQHATFLGIKIYQRSPPITSGNIQQLISWIISLNYNKLSLLENFSSRFEIQQILIGIISDKIGIPVPEIEPHHRITNDLRIE